MACGFTKPVCPGKGLAQAKLREGAVRLETHDFAEGTQGWLDLVQPQIGLPEHVMDLRNLREYLCCGTY